MSLAVAIVGLGYFSQFHQDAWSRCPEARVIGITDNNPARVAEAAKRFPQARTFNNIEAMLDAVHAQNACSRPPRAIFSLLIGAAECRIYVQTGVSFSIWVRPPTYLKGLVRMVSRLSRTALSSSPISAHISAASGG